jgi:hypothetical protein
MLHHPSGTHSKDTSCIHKADHHLEEAATTTGHVSPGMMPVGGGEVSGPAVVPLETTTTTVDGGWRKGTLPIPLCRHVGCERQSDLLFDATFARCGLFAWSTTTAVAGVAARWSCSHSHHRRRRQAFLHFCVPREKPRTRPLFLTTFSIFGTNDTPLAMMVQVPRRMIMATIRFMSFAATSLSSCTL